MRCKGGLVNHQEEKEEGVKNYNNKNLLKEEESITSAQGLNGSCLHRILQKAASPVRGSRSVPFSTVQKRNEFNGR